MITLKHQYRKDGYFVFKFDVGDGATMWVHASVDGEVLTLLDLKFEDAEGHPAAYDTGSTHAVYKTGVKLGYAVVKQCLRQVVMLVKTAYPNIKTINATRMETTANATVTTSNAITSRYFCSVSSTFNT